LTVSRAIQWQAVCDIDTLPAGDYNTNKQLTQVYVSWFKIAPRRQRKMEEASFLGLLGAILKDNDPRITSASLLGTFIAGLPIRSLGTGVPRHDAEIILRLLSFEIAPREADQWQSYAAYAYWDLMSQ
jgi:hypothetical protein